LPTNESLEKLQRDAYVRYDDLPLETRDGRRIAVEFVSNVYQSGDHKVIQCNIRDITIRKRTEEELQWKTALLEAQVHSSLDGILVVDDHGKILVQNQRLTELWKIAAHGSDPEDDAVQMKLLAAQTQQPREFEERVAYLDSHPNELSRDEIQLTDGSVLDRYSSPVRDQSGKHYGRIWTFRDVTERKRSEESHARLAMAVEQSVETVVITDTHASILYANPAFERTTGYKLAEVLGRNARILKSGNHGEEFYRVMWETLMRGETWSGHFVNRRKDNSLYEEEATISPIRDESGVIVNYVAVKRDVTREKELEAQFLQSQRMDSIGKLAGGVAHDFNNILSVILMQCALSRTVENTPAEVREGLAEIATAAERAATLTRQLLLFSRKQVMQSRQLDLNEVVASLASMLRRVLREDVSLELRLHPTPLMTYADAGMLDQVLMNLTINARDAMPGGGRLVIETAERFVDAGQDHQSLAAPPGQWVWLGVSDTGNGIAPEILPHIFEPFFTTKDVGQGTGLGLATVFGVVKQHKGWIKVHSELGQGTTFRVFLRPATGPAREVLFDHPTQQPAFLIPIVTALRGHSRNAGNAGLNGPRRQIGTGTP
jgi:two-component system cell cycle sensor histidine kinase/response regulator CckA